LVAKEEGLIAFSVFRYIHQATQFSSRLLDQSVTASSALSDAAAHWNTRFAGDDFLFGTEPNHWLRNHVNAFPRGGRVLCVADGEGRNSVFLAKLGFVVDAFDISSAAITKARRLAATSDVTVTYQLADCDSFSWKPGSYNGVAAIFVQFADPALRSRMFARIVESLKPGGVLILQGYTPKQLEYRTGGPSNIEHLYTEAILRDAFAQLTILELKVYESEVTEGTGHCGRSALIGLVARR
jgi:2-polyprenyl-3-methyl-5-hydroxy-6-metoxy-1,4-benzoquinol methylase